MLIFKAKKLSNAASPPTILSLDDKMIRVAKKKDAELSQDDNSDSETSSVCLTGGSSKRLSSEPLELVLSPTLDINKRHQIDEIVPF